MNRTTPRDPNVIRHLQEGFVSVAVDATKSRELVRALGVTAYPTMIVVSPQAKVLDTIQGYVAPRQLLRQLPARRVHAAAFSTNRE